MLLAKPRALLTLLVLPFSLHLAQSHAEEAHPGLSAEASYAEAVVSFNKGEHATAVRALDELLARAPGNIEALELLALSLKALGDDKRSIETYTKLTRLKKEPERGPYYFELGVILNRQKRAEQARAYFERCVRLDFNKATSHLYLGLSRFNSGELARAQEHFDEVKAEDNAELQALARYYLGLIHFKNGYGAGGTYEMLEARSIAAEAGDSKVAADISSSAEKMLAPFGASQWFGSAMFLGQYDSNITQTPAGEGSTVSSSKATPNFVLNGGIGRMSSPLAELQWVGSYRFSVNRTTNAEARTYEFFNNTPSLNLNYRPLARTTGGLRLEGGFTVQNRLPDGSLNPADGYLFRRYSSGVEVGPFVRHEFSRALQLQLDASYRTQTIETDPGLTGSSLLAHATFRFGGRSRLLNPGASLSFERNNATSTEWKYTAMGVGGTNTFHLAAADTLTLNVDLLRTSYPQSTSQRSDTNLTARVSFMHAFSAHWSLLADLTAVTHRSSLPETYSYSRFLTGIGVGWTL